MAIVGLLVPAERPNAPWNDRRTLDESIDADLDATFARRASKACLSFFPI